MSEANTNNSGETPIILPTPVALTPCHEPKWAVMARFFSWLTGLTLSISVLVALISVTSDRNNLQAQLTCRATSNFVASRASYNKQVALADHSVLIGKFLTTIIQVPADDPTRAAQLNDIADQLVEADKVLEVASDTLREAIGQQQAALTSC